MRVSQRPSVLLGVVMLAMTAAAAPAAEVKLGGRTFTLPDGFTIEPVAGPPLVDRPIVADFDEQGRLYVADSSGSSEKVEKQLAEKPHRIVRLEDTNGDGRFDKRTVFADHMMFPEGAMWFDGSLYVSAPPSIWKLTDTDGDGIADQRVEWFQGKTLTGCANDLHGPYLGPDGWIYWCKGAFAQQTYERPGKKPFVTRAAHIFRARPDGSGIEPVMTGGMDNPVDVVFTPGGERIFSTTFLVNPAGGHRDGLIHAVYGGVYGKVHDVIDGHIRTSPDVMPVLSHLGPAAVCGLTRYESDAFGPQYTDNLFATCFNLRKVTRHELTPDGATFKSKDSDFLVCDDLDFHPTDVIEDADGSLLVIDTGGWYKLCCPTSQLQKADVLGRIYRVRRTDAKRIDDPRGLKLDWTGATDEQLAQWLDDPRPSVRKRAVQVLGDRGAEAVPAIEQVISHSESPCGRLNAVWAATRIDAAAARTAVRRALLDADEVVRQAATHSVSAWRDRDAALALDVQIFESRPSPAIQRVTAEALGRIDDGHAVYGLLKKLAEPADRVLEHSLIYALIEIRHAQATATGLKSDNARVRRAAMIALDQMDGGGLDALSVAAELSSPDPALRETAAWIAGRHPEWGDALAGALKQRMRAADLTPEARTQLQEQLARLSKSLAIQELLAERAVAPGAATGEGRLAFAAMAGSGAKELPAAWGEAIASVIGGKDIDIIPSAIAAARRLPLKGRSAEKVADELFRAAGRDDLPADARLEALAALPGGGRAVAPELFDFLTARLAPDSPAAQRVAAADVLGRAKLTAEQLTALIPVIRSAGPLEIDRLLAAYQQSNDDEVGLKLVAALKEAKAAKALRADMVKPRLAKFGPSVQKEAEELLARLNPDAEAQRAKLAELLSSLPPGDVRRGQLVFNSQRAACVTCHAIGYVGGHVGPDLTRVGATRAERDLLESIVFPSASFVQSFEPLMVRTRAGDIYSGVVRRNDADEVVLATGPDQEVRVARQDVQEMRPGTVSVMPTGLDQQISKQELADLVAFLKACR